jgi:hypothetical protein
MTSLTVVGKPTPTPAPDANYTFITIPPGAAVYIDGKKVGTT